MRYAIYGIATCFGGWYGHYLTTQQNYLPANDIIPYYLSIVCSLVVIYCLIYFWLDGFSLLGWFCGVLLGIPVYVAITLVAVAFVGIIVSFPMQLFSGGVVWRIGTIVLGGIGGIVFTAAGDIALSSIMELAANKKRADKRCLKGVDPKQLLEKMFTHFDNRFLIVGDSLLNDPQTIREETAGLAPKLEIPVKLARTGHNLWKHAYDLKHSDPDRLKTLLSMPLPAVKHVEVKAEEPVEVQIEDRIEDEGVNLSEDQLAEIFCGLDHKYQQGITVASDVEIEIVAADNMLNDISAKTAVCLWAKTYDPDKTTGDRAQTAALMLDGYEFPERN